MKRFKLVISSLMYGKEGCLYYDEKEGVLKYEEFGKFENNELKCECIQLSRGWYVRNIL